MVVNLVYYLGQFSEDDFNTQEEKSKVKSRISYAGRLKNFGVRFLSKTDEIPRILGKPHFQNLLTGLHSYNKRLLSFCVK